MTETFYVVPVAAHEALVRGAYIQRGFDAAEAEHAHQHGVELISVELGQRRQHDAAVHGVKVDAVGR